MLDGDDEEDHDDKDTNGILADRSVHCSLLAEDAIKSAIKDYQTKREKRLAMAAVSLHPAFDSRALV